MDPGYYNIAYLAKAEPARNFPLSIIHLDPPSIGFRVEGLGFRVWGLGS